MAMRGCWLMEVEELNAMRRSEEAAVKAFVTRCEDRLILKYANEPSVYQRRTVLVGTVNPQADGFLRGVRDDEDSRYLPVTVGKIDVEGVAAIRDQLFAEAKERILSGIPWWEQDALARDNVHDARRARQESNIYESAIREWLPLRATAEYTTIAEVMERALDITQKERWSSKSLQMQVAAALKSCGWRRVVKFIQGKTARVWIEEEKENQLDRDIPF